MRIEAEWQRDRAAKERYYAAEGEHADSATAAPPLSPIAEGPTWWSRMKGWLGKR